MPVTNRFCFCQKSSQGGENPSAPRRGADTVLTSPREAGGGLLGPAGLEEHAVSPTGPTGNQGDTCAPFLSPAVTFLQGVLLIFLVCCCSQLFETHQRKGKGSKARGTCHSRALEGEYSRDMLQQEGVYVSQALCSPLQMLRVTFSWGFSHHQVS